MADDRKTRPLFGEIAIATGARDVTRGFLDGVLQKPGDGILATRGGGDYRLYEDLLTDWQVKSTFQQRRLAVISREWVVDPGGKTKADKMAADFLAEQLDNIEWDEKTRKMLSGVFFGYAVGEILWARDGRRIAIQDIKVRRRQRFRFGQGGELRLLTRDNPDGLVMPPRKFWHFETGAEHDDEPYGLGLGHWLYWPVFFKRNGIKFWLIFLEKFGAPTAVGKFPPNATPADKEKLLEAVNAIQTDAGVIIPDGMMIELLEATRAGTSDHKIFEKSMDGAIAKVVLSQTMTTDDGSSRAQADVHMDVRQEVVKADSDLVCGSFNRGPAQWLTEWNFPGARPPKVWRRVEDDPDLKPQAERDKLIYDMGFKPTPDYIEETYGEGWEPRDMTPPPAPGQPPAPGEEQPEGEEFAERCPGCGAARFAEGARPTDPADEITDALEAAAAETMDEMIGQIRDLVDSATSMQDLADRLLQLYPEISTDRLGEALAQALAVAELRGRADIAERS